MALVDLPESPKPAAIAWQLVDFGSMQKGALGGAMQRVNRLGGRWALSVTMPPLTAAQAREGSAALTKGVENGVRIKLVQPDNPTGSPGSVLVNGASQAGSSLVCDGATPGFVARAGMFCTITTGGQRYCYHLTDTTRADASGNLTLNLVPRLRVEPADNDAVELGAPQIEGLLQSVPGWAFDVDRVARGISFVIEETR